ncbi:MAG: sigma-70 family RNA polymerase sigma factor, partial [Caldisericales bacterium]|nr:sigma-70 family RNA polymerase sigma factor [Caldisericales bacterium]
DSCKERVAKIAFYVLGNRDEAEDVAQEAFLKAFVGIRSLKDGVPFDLWVSKISRNLSIDRLRKRRPQADPVEEWSKESEPETILDMRKAIMELPALFRLPLTMLYFDDMSTDAIARILGIPQGTVKSRIHKAKEMIKRRLGAQF